jgi:cytoskeletal protein CcmA (bactofilin family)
MWNWKDSQTDKRSARPGDAHASAGYGDRHETSHDTRRTSMAQTTAHTPAMIGQSIHIKGELTGNEDLIIDGVVEGRIDLKEHHLTIGKNGRIKADLQAKTITIIGEVLGHVTAEDKVELGETAKLQGNIVTPRLAIADGALFKGSVEMNRAAMPAKESAARTEPVNGRAPQRVAIPV